MLLTRWLLERKAAPQAFEWAGSNCTHFAASWVAHATGRAIDTAAWCFPGPLAAYRHALRAGGMDKAITAAVGCEPRSAALAQVGDLVLLPVDGHLVEDGGAGGALGICCGRMVVCIGPGGECWYVTPNPSAVSWSLFAIGAAS